MGSEACRFCGNGRATRRVIVRNAEGEELCRVKMCSSCLEWRRKNLFRWFDYEESEKSGGVKDGGEGQREKRSF